MDRRGAGCFARHGCAERTHGATVNISVLSTCEIRIAQLNPIARGEPDKSDHDINIVQLAEVSYLFHMIAIYHDHVISN